MVIRKSSSCNNCSISQQPSLLPLLAAVSQGPLVTAMCLGKPSKHSMTKKCLGRQTGDKIMLFNERRPQMVSWKAEKNQKSMHTTNVPTSNTPEFTL